MKSAEQQARDLLEELGYKDAQALSAGDVVTLANYIADANVYRRQRDRNRKDELQTAIERMELKADEVKYTKRPTIRQIKGLVALCHRVSEEYYKSKESNASTNG